MNLRPRVLLSVPHMSGGEMKYVRGAFESNWLSTVGPNLSGFEAAIERRVGVPAAALASGTAAIHLGLRLLGVGRGDEVLCPTLTFAATCNAVRYLGAEPVLVDSERATWGMDANLLEDALRARAASGRLPRAVVVVHLYGQCAAMDELLAVCARYEVPVLEDAAQALGATYKGRAAGSMGLVGAFSFNGNKIITTTGGGALVSARAEWVEKARFWAQQARDPGIAYEHSELGYNYRMSNVLAGIGRGQMEVLDLRIEQRRGIAFRYRDALADVAGLQLMPQAGHGVHTNWLSCFVMDEEVFGCTRWELIAALERENIESRPVWKPMHLQPLYRCCESYGGRVAEDLFAHGICLPSSSSLTEADQDRVIEAVRRAAGSAKRRVVAAPTGAITRRAEANGAAEETARFAGEGRWPDRGVEEVLGRELMRIDDAAIEASLRGQVVLVTGAAGSIGAELCRQIGGYAPAAIVAFDTAESALFALEEEMRRDFGHVPFHAQLGSVRDRARVNEVLGRYRPSMLYHAAAFKHVPLMEAHPIEAVENNVLGTWQVAEAAEEHGVERFVLISTDKAVRPASVMGATKRMAEMVVGARRGSGTSFVTVRFGNVLDSNGSVMPIFRRQIAAGGPVTVTHPEMQRYFMTKGEAGQLVLQVGALGEAGRTYVLDVGQPIKIVDLAKKMARMAGMAEGTIRIEITGMRAGEKLVEALWEEGEAAAASGIRYMGKVDAGCASPNDVRERVEELRVLCAQRDEEGLVGAMKAMVASYTPSEELTREVARRSAGRRERPADKMNLHAAR